VASTVDTHPWRFLRHNPLVPAAALFLVGIALGQWSVIPAVVALTFAVTFWMAWLIGELFFPPIARPWFTHISLSLAILFAGTTVWQLDQQQVESTHIARFAPAIGEIPITLRASVLVPPPPNGDHHGNTYFTIDAAELFTNQGWIPSFGTSQIKWRASPVAPELHCGDLVEIYGWQRQPPTALNPGGLDMRRRLAADRIFTEIRVPRTTGIIILKQDGDHGSPLLPRLRLFLRSKLLEHTVNIDTDAANTMVALLLGQRDPSIDDISQAFAAAGVAHLLAISGAHIVFLAAIVWLLLRFVPIRPQWREPLCGIIVIAYVLATPCGPPVVRAAIILAMAVISRFLRRPAAYMNMLSAAVICIVLLRPAEVLDAGFQLTFVCTAALILLAERVYHALFRRFLERAQLIADLRNTSFARFKLRMQKTVAMLITANVIGALTAAPLVVYHFSRINPYGFLEGLLPFPAVAITMLASLVQLLLELVSSNIAAVFAPISTGSAQVTVWIIERLAAVPGAVFLLRSPPPMIIGVLYVPLILWIARRRLFLSRALVLNMFLAALCIVAGWYLFTQPMGEIKIQVLSVGQGSSVVITTPRGDTVLVNAGSRDLPDIVQSAIGPTLRADAVRTLRGLILTSVDTVHARDAGDVVGRYPPSAVFMPPEDTGTTFAGMSVDDAMSAARIPRVRFSAGDCLDLGRSAKATILSSAPTAGLVILLEYANRRVLLLDPANVPALALLQINNADLRSDAVVLLGPERGVGDAVLRKLLEEAHAGMVVWSGRTAWAPHVELPGNYNTADGFFSININSDGQLHFQR